MVSNFTMFWEIKGTQIFLFLKGTTTFLENSKLFSPLVKNKECHITEEILISPCKNLRKIDPLPSIFHFHDTSYLRPTNFFFTNYHDSKIIPCYKPKIDAPDTCDCNWVLKKEPEVSGKFSNFLEKIGNKKIIRNWVHVFVFRFQSKKFLSKYLFLISMEQELLSCSLRWSQAVPIAKQIEFDAFWAGKQTKYVPETIQNVKNETN